ncbi:acylpyruvate hydrolase [Psychrobacillus insolitus]|uniref:Acylpyruvate hydrolase n=1 Tax=Psychrobacillus insolitus TaxID=1461 RepID=A0A2W7MUF9_9BACI|nr:fumarylacetoacetate hydrolase family protein [Psychrobacillus insolitus]PZX07451.1 acylpyruvate hydrolase [Psychrobacillus insolitus]
MKLITFTREGISTIGAIVNEEVVDLHIAYRTLLQQEGKIRAQEIADAFVPADMTGFLQGGKETIELAKKAVDFALTNKQVGDIKLVHALNTVKVGAPVPKPGKIFAVGHNYKEHILEMGRQLPSHPVLFAKFGNTVIGPEDDIPFYPVSDQLDYEAEFAFVIGKRAKNVSEEDALDYVAGYAVANDVTYRDIQRRTLQWLQGKTVDGSLPMGPWLITADEIADPQTLEMVLTVNGEERQRTNTANQVFSVKHLVAFLSNLATLEPGDIVITGTPGGVIQAMEPQVWLKDGDVVRVEIDQVGVLENTVRTVKGE